LLIIRSLDLGGKIYVATCGQIVGPSHTCTHTLSCDFTFMQFGPSIKHYPNTHTYIKHEGWQCLAYLI